MHKLPADLRTALLADPVALDAWRDITPLARNEFICWVEDAKRPATRDRRIRRTQRGARGGHAAAVLLAGVRPPRAERPVAPTSERPRSTHVDPPRPAVTRSDAYWQGERVPVRFTLNRAPLMPRESSAAQNFAGLRWYSALKIALVPK